MSKYAFIIEPSAHARLSASSAERWINCPGSVQLSKGLPNVSSKYAAEGTAAHYIAAFHQYQMRDGVPESLVRWVGQTALVEGHEIRLTDDLLDAVEEFLDYIVANEELTDKVMIEQTFTPAMRKLDDEFGGSTDRIIWRERSRLLRVYDYKHGAGVPVDVDDNKQLKYYALGALLTNPQFNAETVELVIAQPRCDHQQGRIRTYALPAIALLDYAADLMDSAKRTREWGADLNPGKKQCQFCPANGANKCPAIQKQTQALVAAQFDVVGDLALYSKVAIAEFLTKLPLVEQRIAAVREFAYQAALRGEEIPGFKVVEKRATRKWKDEAAASDALAASPACFTEPELRSPAQVEKVVGKKKFKSLLLDQHIEKRSSGYTLAPDSDPRPTAQAAQLSDFSVVAGNAE